MTKVFVSSTCYDLLDVRAELEVHLEALGLEPVLSDRPTSAFVAGGHGDSIETCLVNLRQCDHAVFLFSQRYGHPLPGTYNKLSATHVEYNEALKLGLEPLVYVRDRLLGEYSFWRSHRGKRGLKFRWLQDDHHELFKLLDSRESNFKAGNTGSNAPSNWMSSFSSSVDLKEAIAKDLARTSSEEIMRRLIRIGEAPAMAVVVTANNGSTPDLHVTLSFVNASSVAALNVRWFDAQNTPRSQGVIMPHQFADNLPYGMKVPQKPAIGELLLTYETATGYSIADSFHVICSDNMRVYTELKRRELLGRVSYEVA